MTQILQDILKLSVPERILILEAIWDSIAEKDDQVGLSPDAKQLLEERLEAHNRNRDEGSSWTEVKARIKGATLMYKLIVKPFAEEDAAKAAVWYNDKSKGLGNEFLLVLDAKINEIQRNPNRFQVIYKNIRRALTSRFPYGIFL